MKAESISNLRAESLAATLGAARGRRIRRRLTVAVGPALVLGIILLKIYTGERSLPTTPDAPIVATAAPEEETVAGSAGALVIRTKPDGFDRLTTSSNVIRLKTDRTVRVERISTEDLVRTFPEKTIMIVHPGSSSSNALIF